MIQLIRLLGWRHTENVCLRILANYTCTYLPLALRIHISSETAAALETFGTFTVELRGQVEMKVREIKFDFDFQRFLGQGSDDNLLVAWRK